MPTPVFMSRIVCTCVRTSRRNDPFPTKSTIKLVFRNDHAGERGGEKRHVGGGGSRLLFRSMSLAVTEFSVNKSIRKPCNSKTLQWAEVFKNVFG